jgi:hypothetical protein
MTTIFNQTNVILKTMYARYLIGAIRENLSKYFSIDKKTRKKLFGKLLDANTLETIKYYFPFFFMYKVKCTLFVNKIF